jgi:hypothetical protein
MSKHMGWRTLAKRAGILIALIFAALQFSNPVHTNPATDESLALERTETVPPNVARILDGASRDCHSNDTHWRWYTYVAPLSWWTSDHVKKGRAELNFSIWGSYSPRFRAARLHAICSMTESHEMPLRAYALAHPDARVSDDDVRQLCAWTQTAAYARGSS